jgi:hypothetical protein
MCQCFGICNRRDLLPQGYNDLTAAEVGMSVPATLSKLATSTKSTLNTPLQRQYVLQNST